MQFFTWTSLDKSNFLFNSTGVFASQCFALHWERCMQNRSRNKYNPRENGQAFGDIFFIFVHSIYSLSLIRFHLICLICTVLIFHIKHLHHREIASKLVKWFLCPLFSAKTINLVFQLRVLIISTLFCTCVVCSTFSAQTFKIFDFDLVEWVISKNSRICSATFVFN